MASARPDRTTMEGMIWNANQVLEQALDPGSNGIPKGLFEKSIGVILLSVVEVGFIFSGNVGTGIILAKNDEGGWSQPCACGLTGVGWGFLVGGSLKDIIIFVMDRQTMDTVTGDVGIKFGGQAEIALGPFGRTGQIHLNLSNKGIGSTVAVAYSKGAFLGLSVEGAVASPRAAVNESFYGKPDVTTKGILFNNAVTFPEGKVTMINEVYEKLAKLSAGATAVADASEQAKKSVAKSEADKAAVVANSQPDVVQVDASAEAAKE